MERSASYRVNRRRASLAVLLVASVCAALALAACGGNAAPSSSSETSQSSAGQQLSASYYPVKYVSNFNDGATRTVTAEWDDRGRQLGYSFELVASEGTSKYNETYSDWDEFGHYRKTEGTYDYGDGNSGSYSMESKSLDVNEDGFATSSASVISYANESVEEGALVSSSRKITTTYEYGDDAAVLRKRVILSEDYDQSDKLISSLTTTDEFDENGLQTAHAEKLVDADGAESTVDVDITWTMDENGNPVSYQAVFKAEGEDPSTVTGDVTVNDQGQISTIGNVKVNGEAYTTTAEITYMKFDDPLQNGYEGWKSFTLTEVIMSTF